MLRFVPAAAPFYCLFAQLKQINGLRPQCRCDFSRTERRGVPRRQAAAAVYSHRGRWAMSNTRAVTKAYPNGWFIAVQGQAIRSGRKLPHWFDVDRWIRLA